MRFTNGDSNSSSIKLKLKINILAVYIHYIAFASQFFSAIFWLSLFFNGFRYKMLSTLSPIRTFSTERIKNENVIRLMFWNGRDAVRDAYAIALSLVFPAFICLLNTHTHTCCLLKDFFAYGFACLDFWSLQTKKKKQTIDCYLV